MLSRAWGSSPGPVAFGSPPLASRAQHLPCGLLTGLLALCSPLRSPCSSSGGCVKCKREFAAPRCLEPSYHGSGSGAWPDVMWPRLLFWPHRPCCLSSLLCSHTGLGAPPPDLWLVLAPAALCLTCPSHTFAWPSAPSARALPSMRSLLTAPSPAPVLSLAPCRFFIALTGIYNVAVSTTPAGR